MIALAFGSGAPGSDLSKADPMARQAFDTHGVQVLIQPVYHELLHDEQVCVAVLLRLELSSHERSPSPGDQRAPFVRTRTHDPFSLYPSSLNFRSPFFNAASISSTSGAQEIGRAHV